MDRYGKMEEVLTDRGFVFYSWHGINRFEKFLESECIHQTHASPHHPQTLGKVESVNKQIQKELIRRQHFNSTAECDEAISGWIDMYNYRRTHQGLGSFLVPADRFHGRVVEVTKAISGKIDPEGGLCYDGNGVSRSIVNLVWEAGGGMTLYILGQPANFIGGHNERNFQR
jgi:hypothetical protein